MCVMSYFVQTGFAEMSGSFTDRHELIIEMSRLLNENWNAFRSVEEIGHGINSKQCFEKST
jgi:hypothetical protein